MTDLTDKPHGIRCAASAIPTATAILLAVAGTAFTAQPSALTGLPIHLTPADGRVLVTVGEAPFTEYRYTDVPKPVLYPVYLDDATTMTRHYPFETIAGEATDHPHHQSIWFAHGSVNGVDFWSIRKGAGTIVETTPPTLDGDTLRGRRAWRDASGKTICTDVVELRFGARDGLRWIDYRVTINASEGELVFGDTKEGMMAIRTNPNLRLAPDPKHGVERVFGHAVNSAGDRDAALWGKRADWVAYWGTIDGRNVGIAMFDDPANPRHPTWWHARTYGLVAANPFGLHHFEGKPPGTGNMRLESGKTITFAYRLLFYSGTPESVDVAGLYKAWTEH